MSYSSGYSGEPFAGQALQLIGGLKKAPSVKVRGERPPKAPKARRGRQPRLSAIPKSLQYAKITAKNPLRISREEKLLGAGLGLANQRALKAAGTRALQAGSKVIISRAAVAGFSKAAVARAAASQILGPAAIAGMAAYYITTALLNKKARTLEEKQLNAFRAAQAYRNMRLDIAAKQRRPLTPAQQRQAANTFKVEMAKLGYSTSDLRDFK